MSEGLTSLHALTMRISKRRWEVVRGLRDEAAALAALADDVEADRMDGAADRMTAERVRGIATLACMNELVRLLESERQAMCRMIDRAMCVAGEREEARR